VARKMPKTLEELRTETKYQLANGPPRVPGAPPQKIVNRFLEAENAMRSLQVIAHSDKPRIEWIHCLSPATKDLWAPDVSYSGACTTCTTHSVFGKNTSSHCCICPARTSCVSRLQRRRWTSSATDLFFGVKRAGRRASLQGMKSGSLRWCRCGWTCLTQLLPIFHLLVALLFLSDSQLIELGQGGLRV